MRQNFRNILLLMLIPIIINASGGGSIYSRYGVGRLTKFYLGREMGTGSFGIGVPNFNNINLINPAANYKLQYTKFSLGLSLNSINADDGKVSSLYNRTNFSGFNMAFPIQKDYGITMLMGVLPFSSVDYEILTQQKNSLGKYSERFIGEGGISKIFVGASYNFPFNIALGAQLDYYSGTIKRTNEIEFQNKTELDKGRFLNQRKYSGVGFTLGLLSPDFSGVLRIEKLKDLRLGFAYSYSNKLNTDTTLFTGQSGRLEEIETGEAKTEIPHKISFGLSFKFDDNYLFMMDYSYSPWDKYKFNNNVFTEFSQNIHYNIGMEYKRTKISQYDNLWKQMAVRFGASYEKINITLNDKDINQYEIHAGFSFPMGKTGAIDFGFAYGVRGTTDSNLIEENFFQTNITLSFGEFWFIRQDR